jgi:hypothetical protein
VVLASGYAELATALPPSVIKISKPFDQASLERAVAAASARAGRKKPRVVGNDVAR